MCSCLAPSPALRRSAVGAQGRGGSAAEEAAPSDGRILATFHVAGPGVRLRAADVRGDAQEGAVRDAGHGWVCFRLPRGQDGRLLSYRLRALPVREHGHAEARARPRGGVQQRRRGGEQPAAHVRQALLLPYAGHAVRFRRLLLVGAPSPSLSPLAPWGASSPRPRRNLRRGVEDPASALAPFVQHDMYDAL